MKYAIQLVVGPVRWRLVDGADDCTAAEVFFDGILPTAAIWDGTTVRSQTAAELLVASKTAATAANRAECSSRIYARYPAGRQSSVALGVYSGPEAEAQAAIMKDWIADMVAAENAAADAIEAATTVAAVEAVSVSWPA